MTSGTVISSVVEQHESSGSHGVTYTYSPNIKYRYRIAGKEHIGDCYRHGQGASSDDSACKIVSEHPVGKEVAVYFNPVDPADSLLQPGLDGSDLFMAMFMLPFNLVGLGILALAGRMAWRRCVGYRGIGAKVWDDGIVVRVHLPLGPPIVAAALVVGMLAFCAIFPVAFLFGGSHPSKSLMYHVWTLILASAGGLHRRPLEPEPGHLRSGDRHAGGDRLAAARGRAQTQDRDAPGRIEGN